MRKSARAQATQLFRREIKLVNFQVYLSLRKKNEILKVFKMLKKSAERLRLQYLKEVNETIELTKEKHEIKNHLAQLASAETDSDYDTDVDASYESDDAD